MNIIFAIFLLTLMVITAAAIVRTENLFVAVMLTTIFSLLMATNFFVLDAADVALTEAAVGAGVTTVLFLSALALTGDHERPDRRRHFLAVATVGTLALLMIYATFDTPRLGDPDAPVHQHVAPWYLEKTPEYIDIPNVVTAVLGSFRGYDTLGELIVVFTACIGVLFILGIHPKGMPTLRDEDYTGLRHHLIPQVVGRLIIPFILLFGLYVQFHGDYGPGGGFQAGTLIATAVILYALLEGEAEALRAIPAPFLMGLAIGGTLLYGSVGIAGILLGGSFLDYSVLASDAVHGQHLGILLIEAGVGMGVCGALLLIFHAFAGRGSHPR